MEVFSASSFADSPAHQNYACHIYATKMKREKFLMTSYCMHGVKPLSHDLQFSLFN